MAGKSRDVEQVARHFQQRVACLYSCVPLRNALVKTFCQSMNTYVFSHMIKEDYNTIQNGVDIPEHFEQVLADVAVGLNRELNQFMDFVYTIELIFSPGLDIGINRNVQLMDRTNEKVTLHTLKEKLYDCMYKITPLVDQVVEKFKDISVVREEELRPKKKPEPKVVVEQIIIDSDSDAEPQDTNVEEKEESCKGEAPEGVADPPEANPAGDYPAPEDYPTPEDYPPDDNPEHQGGPPTHASQDSGMEEGGSGYVLDPGTGQMIQSGGGEVRGHHVLDPGTGQMIQGSGGGGEVRGHHVLDPSTGQMIQGGGGGGEVRGQAANKPGILVCEICAKPFTTNAALLKHYGSHTDERPYICDRCGKSFKSRSCLRQHADRLHSEEARTRYQCHQCPQSFVTNSALTLHIRKKHMDESSRPFKCDECGKGFVSKPRLEDHRNEHTGDRPYTCEVCGKSFADRRNLGKHRRKQHLSRTDPDWRVLKLQDIEHLLQP